jgi:hypothetical protein
LRRLWEEYLVALKAMRVAWAFHKEKRESTGYDAEFDSLKNQYDRRWGELHRILWKKHSLGASSRAATQAHRKLIKITKAIRSAKAEGLFGIGVKLSVSEHFEDFDVIEGAEDARRALYKITGYDFVAATGPLNDDE